MPGMSAPDFIEAVRALQPALPVVFMSGYTAEARSGGKRLPEDVPIVAKPFESTHLLREIRTAIERPGAEEPA
jgi:FixJ family two-component response regulator